MKIFKIIFLVISILCFNFCLTCFIFHSFDTCCYGEEGKDMNHDEQENETLKHNEHSHDDHDDGCGAEKFHDHYLMDTITMQPWRHPELIGKELLMKRLFPVVVLFLIMIVIRPIFNKYFRSMAK